MTVTDLMDLIPMLAVAYGVVLGAVVLTTGWQLFRDRQPRKKRGDAVAPPVTATGQDGETAR